MTATTMRKTALAAGIFYLLTFATSLPQLGLFHDVLNDPDWVLGAGSETPVLIGSFLEVLVGLTGVATAVILYRVTRRVDPKAAVGFVTTRVMEAALIFTGILAVLTIVTLRQEPGTADAGMLTTTAKSLVAMHDWTFLLGPGVMPALNALCLGTVLYRSRLVPRALPVIGLIGAPLLVASSTMTLFGVHEQVSDSAMFMALPIAAWEFGIGVYMTVKGFRPEGVAELVDDETPVVHAIAA
jgi:hypothetical protein